MYYLLVYVYTRMLTAEALKLWRTFLGKKNPWDYVVSTSMTTNFCNKKMPIIQNFPRDSKGKAILSNKDPPYFDIQVKQTINM